MGKTKKYYAVARGRKPGVYTDWFGSEGAEEQVRGFTRALYKGFASSLEARRWLENPTGGVSMKVNTPKVPVTPPSPGEIAIYTDGSCRGNPGPGGYGVIIVAGEKKVEIAEGFRWTTNNRMEMMACIAALRTLETRSDVVLYSDSSYVVNGITKGWAHKWRAKPLDAYKKTKPPRTAIYGRSSWNYAIYTGCGSSGYAGMPVIPKTSTATNSPPRRLKG